MGNVELIELSKFQCFLGDHCAFSEVSVVKKIALGRNLLISLEVNLSKDFVTGGRPF